MGTIEHDPTIPRVSSFSKASITVIVRIYDFWIEVMTEKERRCGSSTHFMDILAASRSFTAEPDRREPLVGSYSDAG